jgi:hypothetical protein
MQLSVLLPTHRKDIQACARIAQACSWAGPNVEVLVRDNSGDAQKRELLGHFARMQAENCNIVSVEPCGPLKNVTELLSLARGEFVFMFGDDDIGFDRALAALARAIDGAARDASVAGITGTFLIEGAAGSSLASYQDTESGDPAARVTGYLKYAGPNVLVYSAVRRALVNRIMAFIRAMPFYFSYHDQIMSLLYLLNGRFLDLNRLFYLYDIGPWEAPETAQQRDLAHYADAGMDPAMNKLHWFLCGFEGAALIRNADLFPDYPLSKRQPIADLWFSAMFERFRVQQRTSFGSDLTPEVDKLCAVLLRSTGQMSFHAMLAGVSGLMALFSPAGAQSYFDFWQAVIDRRRSEAPVAAAAGG